MSRHCDGDDDHTTNRDTSLHDTTTTTTVRRRPRARSRRKFHSTLIRDCDTGRDGPPKNLQREFDDYDDDEDEDDFVQQNRRRQNKKEISENVQEQCIALSVLDPTLLFLPPSLHSSVCLCTFFLAPPVPPFCIGKRTGKDAHKIETIELLRRETVKQKKNKLNERNEDRDYNLCVVCGTHLRTGEQDPSPTILNNRFYLTDCV